jgi:hypothetical protein
MSNQDSKRAALGGHEEIIITPDTGSATGKPAEDGHISTTDPRAAPAQPDSDPEDEKPLHLDFPAPTFERVEESISTWGMRLPGFSAEWQTRGETQCIRCKVLAVSRTFAVSIRGVVGIGATAEYTGFYPHVHADLEVGGPEHPGTPGRAHHTPPERRPRGRVGRRRWGSPLRRDGSCAPWLPLREVGHEAGGGCAGAEQDPPVRGAGDLLGRGRHSPRAHGHRQEALAALLVLVLGHTAAPWHHLALFSQGRQGICRLQG